MARAHVAYYFSDKEMIIEMAIKYIIANAQTMTIERLKPLFAAMGKKIFRMGETGKGQATKLAMNLQIALIFEGFAEALTLAGDLEDVPGDGSAHDFPISGLAGTQRTRLIDASCKAFLSRSRRGLAGIPPRVWSR